jgi:hypothetical protein
MERVDGRFSKDGERSGMRILYVIDNQTHKMADVRNELLKGHEGKCLDIATAYFNVRGFRLLRDGLVKIGNFRLLIGDEPEKAAAVGLVLKGPSIKRGLGAICSRLLSP